jgi:hypothetical protein
MADKTPGTAPQQGTEYVKGMQDEWVKLEAKGLEHARVVIDEVARLSHAQLAWAAQLGAEWRRVAFDAVRRSGELFAPRS